MSNTLTAVAPRLLAQGLVALRQVCIMPQLVMQGYDDLAARQGSSIDVPIPSPISQGDVTASYIPPANTDISPTYVSINLNKWKYASFYLNDSDMMIAMNGTIPMQASEAIKSIANQVNSDIFALYKSVFAYTGTAGTTPLASAPDAIIDAAKLMDDNLSPVDDRKFMLSTAAEANAKKLTAFQYINQGGPTVMQKGQIGERLGFDFYASQLVPTHTAGTITTGLISKASTAYAIGVTTLLATTAASTGAAALKTGDIILFAGDTQTYALTADATQASAASDVTLTFYPGLKVAHVGSEAVTVKASHVVNLAFHRDAFAFATRPLEGAVEGLGHVIETVVDPQSGLSLRLEISRQWKQTLFCYDILYGCQCIRPELAARLAG